MKIGSKFSHNNGQKILMNKKSSLELDQIINSCNLQFKKGSPAAIKDFMEDKLTTCQWVDKVRVGKSRLTINFLKEDIGVCFQIGNVARTYADILKLNHLGCSGIINVGVIIVPHHLESKKLGTNYANFERLKSEITLFQYELKTPMVVYGLIN
ncbi:MAG: BglII/BstYI family type II restriction endonuclease [Bacteroidota bacterium]